MTQLLDLPAELLSLILSEVGGGSLRKDINNLTICRKWYNAAFEIFHSGRHLRDIDLRGCNINRLADVGSYSGQRKLMHKNTRNLKIRLLGHWRDQFSEQDFALYEDDSEGLEHGKRDREALDNDPYVFGQRTEWEALVDWREDVMRPRLHDLFNDLPQFSFLESFTFESISGTMNNGTALVRYLEGLDLSILVMGLEKVPSLKTLTLDICSGISIQSMHDCMLLSRMIPSKSTLIISRTPKRYTASPSSRLSFTDLTMHLGLETVRLRLDMLCPEILNLNPIGNPFLGPDNTKLKSLVIKMHLPMPPNRPRNVDARTMTCFHGPAIQNPQDMIEAARKFVGDMAKIRAEGKVEGNRRRSVSAALAC